MPALLVCGAISGSFTSFILTPVELIKCQMQVQNLRLYDSATRSSSPSASSSMSTPAGARALIVQVYRDHGISGFWRGQLGTFFRETGGGAAWFGTYEYIGAILRQRRASSVIATPNSDSGGGGGIGDAGNTMTESMFAGAVAGIAYNISLFPADSVKSRMQTDAVLSLGSDSRQHRQQSGFWTVARRMYSAGGVAVFYRGCGMTVVRSAPSSAIIFLTYEYLKKTWG